MEQFKPIFVRNFLIRAVSLVAIFGLVKDSGDLPVYALILTLAKVGGYLVMWPSLRFLLAPVSWKSFQVLSHLCPSLMLYIPQVAIEVYTVLDKTMLGYLLQNNFENGYYEY